MRAGDERRASLGLGAWARPGPHPRALGPGDAHPRGAPLGRARRDSAGGPRGRAASQEEWFPRRFRGRLAWGVCDHPVVPPPPWKKTYLPWWTRDPVYTHLKNKRKNPNLTESTSPTSEVITSGQPIPQFLFFFFLWIQK